MEPLRAPPSPPCAPPWAQLPHVVSATSRILHALQPANSILWTIGALRATGNASRVWVLPQTVKNATLREISLVLPRSALVLLVSSRWARSASSATPTVPHAPTPPTLTALFVILRPTNLEVDCV